MSVIINAVAGTAILLIFVYYYWRKNRGGIYVVFLRKISDYYTKIGTVMMKPNEKKVNFLGKTFIPDMQNLGFRDESGKIGAKTVFYFDYVTAEQLSFQKYKQQIDPEELDILVSRNILVQLTSRLNTATNGTSILLLIMGIGMGVAVGFIIGHVAFPNTVIETAVQNATVTPPVIYPPITPNP